MLTMGAETKCSCDPRTPFVWCDSCNKRLIRKDAVMDAWHRPYGDVMCEPMHRDMYLDRIRKGKS